MYTGGGGAKEKYLNPSVTGLEILKPQYSKPWWNPSLSNTSLIQKE